jgi:hypothetical protein
MNSFFFSGFPKGGMRCFEYNDGNGKVLSGPNLTRDPKKIVIAKFLRLHNRIRYLSIEAASRKGKTEDRGNQ